MKAADPWPVIALLVPFSAFAQDPDGFAADEPAIGEVVVVGSLIKRRVVYECRTLYVRFRFRPRDWAVLNSIALLPMMDGHDGGHVYRLDREDGETA